MEAAACTSEEAYLEAERASEIRHEYVNGMIVAMSGATYIHNLIVTNMAAILRQKLRGRGQVLANEQRVHIPATGMYTYPDVVVVCKKPEFHPKDTMTLLNPRMLVEVLSPATEAYDRGAKFKHYQHISTLLDYMMVAQDGKRVEHYKRLESGQWLYTVADGEDKELAIEDLGLSLPLCDVYEGVDEVEGTSGSAH